MKKRTTKIKTKQKTKRAGDNEISQQELSLIARTWYLIYTQSRGISPGAVGLYIGSDAAKRRKRKPGVSRIESPVGLQRCFTFPKSSNQLINTWYSYSIRTTVRPSLNQLLIIIPFKQINQSNQSIHQHINQEINQSSQHINQCSRRPARGPWVAETGLPPRP